MAMIKSSQASKMFNFVDVSFTFNLSIEQVLFIFWGGPTKMLRGYSPSLSLNSSLIRPYLLGVGGIGGVPLDSHERCWMLDFRSESLCLKFHICHPWR